MPLEQPFQLRGVLIGYDSEAELGARRPRDDAFATRSLVSATDAVDRERRPDRGALVQGVTGFTPTGVRACAAQ